MTCEICVTHGTLCHMTRIQNLERQLAQAKAVIEQQKEVIADLQYEIDTEIGSGVQVKLEQQAALIKSLAGCFRRD